MPKLIRKDRDPQFTARLCEVIDKEKSVSLVARRIARSEGAVRKWMLGESQPNAIDLKLICEVCKADPIWLLFGSQTGREPASSEQSADLERRILSVLLKLLERGA